MGTSYEKQVLGDHYGNSQKRIFNQIRKKNSALIGAILCLQKPITES